MREKFGWPLPGNLSKQAVDATERVHKLVDNMPSPEAGRQTVYVLRLPDGKGGIKEDTFTVDFSLTGHRNLLEGVGRGIHIIHDQGSEPTRLLEYMEWVANLKE